jgi:hypothetical protein
MAGEFFVPGNSEMGFIYFHPSHNHPTDEDLSVGTPVNAKDGAPRAQS